MGFATAFGQERSEFYSGRNWPAKACADVSYAPLQSECAGERKKCSFPSAEYPRGAPPAEYPHLAPTAGAAWDWVGVGLCPSLSPHFVTPVWSWSLPNCLNSQSRASSVLWTPLWFRRPHPKQLLWGSNCRKKQKEVRGTPLPPAGSQHRKRPIMLHHS